MGSQIVGRAFVEAYRQAAANGGKSAASAAAGAGSKSSVSSATNEFTRKTGMSFEEAAKILNVERTTPMEQIEKNYQHLFSVNDKTNGGSFYLQSKVVRAKERMEMELKNESTKKEIANKESNINK